MPAQDEKHIIPAQAPARGEQGGEEGSSSDSSSQSVSGSQSRSSYDDSCSCSECDAHGMVGPVSVPHGFRVRRGRVHTCTVPPGFLLTLSSAALSSGNDSISRHVLEIWHSDGREKQVVARFIPGKVEQVPLSMEITSHAGPCVFALVQGNGSVDVVGTLHVVDDEIAHAIEQLPPSGGRGVYAVGSADSNLSEDDDSSFSASSTGSESSETSASSHESDESGAPRGSSGRGRGQPDSLESSDTSSSVSGADERAPINRNASAKPAAESDDSEEYDYSSESSEEPQLPQEPATKRGADLRKASQPEKPEKPERPAAPAVDGEAPKGFRNVKGVYIKDVAVGQGPVVKQGKNVSIRYVLRVNDPEGPVIDATRNKSLQFTVGAGSVVSGMSIGLAGMKVGGKRILIVPPRLGYGRAGHGGVPGNATLYFEVELVAMRN